MTDLATEVSDKRPGKNIAGPVIVTRPLAQAESLQQKIIARGRQAILFPLLEIRPLSDNSHLDEVLKHLESYALIAFVSPNAISAAFARRPAWPTSVPLAVMGQGSRQALEAHGVTATTTRIFSPLDPHRSDSETLLAVLDMAFLVGRRVLILRGESGRELLADALRAAGALVTQAAAYRRAAPAPDPGRMALLRELLLSHPEWIVTSSEALRILVGLVRTLPQASSDASSGASYGGPEGDAAVALLQQQRLIVPHSRIAETARALGFCNIMRTASGDEALLAALQFLDE
ncbi:MAG: hypothetical protein NVSMB6_18100 [Burkholderiaceae bacterium]